jgi:hypothetical protein
MYSLVIKDKEYKLPERLTINKWKEVRKFDINMSFTHNRILSILLEIPDELILTIPQETKELVIVFLSTLLHPLELLINKEEEFNGEKYIDLNTITLGDFIDLEIYISDGFEKHIEDMVFKLYGTQVREDNYITEVMGGIYHYLKWRNNLYKSYENLFNLNNEGYREEEKPNLSIDEIKKGWYRIIVNLCNENILKMNMVTGLPLIQAFNWLAFHKDKQQEELEKKNELQRHN